MVPGAIIFSGVQPFIEKGTMGKPFDQKHSTRMRPTRFSGGGWRSDWIRGLEQCFEDTRIDDAGSTRRVCRAVGTTTTTTTTTIVNRVSHGADT